jgi:glycosyltransferase involved in cell wall biosynthesis
MSSIAILWAQYGPYHFARVAALKQAAWPGKVHALELANQTSDYEWNRPPSTMELITLCPGSVAERLSFAEVFKSARRTFRELKIEVCFLPSYAPKQSLAALLAAKSLGIRTVMMNESHAGTARARGVGAWVKRQLLGLFDSALVGGQPQKRHFTSLGMPSEKIFTGYDAVENDYFAAKAAEVRRQAREVRRQYQLPKHYFLSLGRFVAKKNLAVLIRAYHQFRLAHPLTETNLVMVGSGEEEFKLRALCSELRLRVYDKPAIKIKNQKSKIENELPGVHFYGFRQIEENPVFYALSDAFILPSLWEEWGLVVNEAMASGLPVVVSATVGCAEDLLENGRPEAVGGEGVEGGKLSGDLTRNLRRNGFIFQPHSVDELATILGLLESQPALRQAMGAVSREIVEKFSCNIFARNALLAARAAMGDNTTSIPLDPLAPERPNIQTIKLLP